MDYIVVTPNVHEGNEECLETTDFNAAMQYL